MSKGIFAPQSVTVSDLFAGALLPGLLLVALYIVYVIVVAMLCAAGRPGDPARSASAAWRAACRDAVRGAGLAPLALDLAVLGSILGGIATPTEAASVGAVGAILLAALRGGARDRGPRWSRP